MDYVVVTLLYITLVILPQLKSKIGRSLNFPAVALSNCHRRSLSYRTVLIKNQNQ